MGSVSSKNDNAHCHGRSCELESFPGQGGDKCAITEGRDGLTCLQEGK